MMTNFEQAIVQSNSSLHRSARVRGHGFDAFAHTHRILSGSRRRSDLLGLGANRFTALPRRFTLCYVIRVGVRLLFFYLVLAIGVQMASEWSAAQSLLANLSRHPPLVDTIRSTSQPIVTTVCSGTIPGSAMLNYAALSIAL